MKLSSQYSLCERCKLKFCKTHSDQKKCSSCIKDEIYRLVSLEPGNRGKKYNCKNCLKDFRMLSISSTCYCSEFCKNNYRSPDDTSQKSDFKEQNKKWVDSKPKGAQKPVCYDELNRREEYKRVFDDKGWDHYLKGKRYDKI